VSSNAPSLEAVTEFTVDTNGFKAEFGHASGGVMTFSSKSGTNELHGSVYEFLRNTELDANRFFSNSANIPRGVYKQSDFGTGSTSLQGQTFGRLTSNNDLANSPRQLQLALKLYF
jgi:hypothetical protein